MNKKVLLSFAAAFAISGCANAPIDPVGNLHQRVLDLNATYSNVNQTYIDSKYILYEINDDVQTEKQFLKDQASEIKGSL